MWSGGRFCNPVGSSASGGGSNYYYQLLLLIIIIGILILKVKVKSLSHVQLFVTTWTVAYQAPLSMGILQARILEWDAISSSGDRPDLEMEPNVSCGSCIAGRFLTAEPLGRE